MTLRNCFHFNKIFTQMFIHALMLFQCQAARSGVNYFLYYTDGIIVPGGPKWCELFLISYRWYYSARRPEVVLTISYIIPHTFLCRNSLSFQNLYYRAHYPKPRHCCKTFGYLNCSRRFMCCDFLKNNGSSKPNTAGRHNAEIVTGRYFSIVAR